MLRAFEEDEITKMGEEKKSLRDWSLLILISSLGLFLELAVIRWLSAEIRIFAYLKNITLLAAFLGLATGFASVGKEKNYKDAFAPLFAVFVTLVILVKQLTAGRKVIYPSSGDEFVWYTADLSYWILLVIFLAIVLLFFLLIMLMFIPLGQATGEEMKRHPPVLAYVVNIAASLLGIWLFSLVSFFQTPPFVWFGLSCLAAIVYFYARNSGISLRNGISFGVVLAGSLFLSFNAVWSPYQRLSLEPTLATRNNGEIIRVGYILDVQQVFYQRTVDLSEPFLTLLNGEFPTIDDLAATYNLPYQGGDKFDDVLVVGAGMGNDVAAALRHGVDNVTAVEIDPAIIEFGREYHPESPYQDGRVTLIANDARSYFAGGTEKYDLVVFGLLDSHSLLSSLSSVRLDSFVYTIESFEQVRELLKPNGVLSITFAANEWIEERIGRMLESVFGEGKVWVAYRDSGTAFLVGGIERITAGEVQVTPWKSTEAIDDLPLSTDDWPYIYMRSRQIPSAYWQVLLVIGITASLFLARSFPETLRPNWHFWFLGVAFLLVEFSSITRLALLFGTTWLVNALAISGVLVMILAANLLVLKRKKINISWMYGLLFASIVLVYFFPLDILSQLPVLPRGLIAVPLLSLPLFFSGIIFSESLRRSGDLAGSLASNLTGSVIGGVLEYSSILWGTQSLYITGGLVYILAFLVFLRAKRR